MNIIAKPTIIHYTEKYPLAANALLGWCKDFIKTQFLNFNELKDVYHNASNVANNRVIFNIKGISFRLIVSINFRTQAAYVVWFGTHKEYDKVDAVTVPYVQV
jgi:mRNA interferase HigB